MEGVVVVVVSGLRMGRLNAIGGVNDERPVVSVSVSVVPFVLSSSSSADGASMGGGVG